MFISIGVMHMQVDVSGNMCTCAFVCEGHGMLAFSLLVQHSLPWTSSYGNMSAKAVYGRGGSWPLCLSKHVQAIYCVCYALPPFTSIKACLVDGTNISDWEKIEQQMTFPLYNIRVHSVVTIAFFEFQSSSSKHRLLVPNKAKEGYEMRKKGNK